MSDWRGAYFSNRYILMWYLVKHRDNITLTFYIGQFTVVPLLDTTSTEAGSCMFTFINYLNFKIFSKRLNTAIRCVSVK